MRFYLTVVLLAGTLAIFGQTSIKTAVTSTSGLPFSKLAAEQVQLKRAIVEFKGFEDRWVDDYNRVPLATWSTLYEFFSESEQPVHAPTELPINLFFTEFDKIERSNILDNLARVMPDLFDLSKDDAAFKADMREKFKNRNFIRRIFNVRDMNKLNMEFRIWQDDQPVEVTRFVMEFRWVTDRERNIEILVAECYLHFDLRFKQQGSSIVRIQFVTPSYFRTKTEQQYYTSFMTNTGRSWKGNIESLYITYPNIGNTVALPYYLEPSHYSYRSGIEVLHLKDVEPERGEKFGFARVRPVDCGCYAGDAVPQFVSFPAAISSVSASSHWKQGLEQEKLCATSPLKYAIVKWVPDIEPGLADMLTVLERPLSTVSSTETLDGILANDCSNSGEPVVKFIQPYHPWWVFDMGHDSIMVAGIKQTGYFGKGTGWCVQSARQGIGEYIEFTTTQPINLIQLFTGLATNEETYNRYNRVGVFELQEVGGNERLRIGLSDIVSSSYEVHLKPGTYRLVVKEVIEGERPDVTCFSDLRFNFSFGDAWFDKFFRQM